MHFKDLKAWWWRFSGGEAREERDRLAEEEYSKAYAATMEERLREHKQRTMAMTPGAKWAFDPRQLQNTAFNQQFQQMSQRGLQNMAITPTAAELQRIFQQLQQQYPIPMPQSAPKGGQKMLAVGNVEIFDVNDHSVTVLFMLDERPTKKDVGEWLTDALEDGHYNGNELVFMVGNWQKRVRLNVGGFRLLIQAKPEFDQHGDQIEKFQCRVVIPFSG